MCPASLSAWTRRSTLTSASSHPSEVNFKTLLILYPYIDLVVTILLHQVAGPAVSRGRMPRRVMMLDQTPTSKKFLSCKFRIKGSDSGQEKFYCLFLLFIVARGLTLSSASMESSRCTELGRRDMQLGQIRILV